MEWGIARAWNEVWSSPMSNVFMFDDPNSKNYFWKQFLGGIFVVVVMTGLDQDSMQKNLTCRNLKESRLNMCVNGLCYLPVNMLFMALGVLMVLYTRQMQLELPTGDALMPALCAGGYLGSAALIYFTLGIVAAAFSSADSAMASLTTSFCVDIARRPDDERLRKWIHPMIGVAFWLFIMVVRAVNNTSVIDAVYTVCSYTYGPILGLFAFGLLTKRQPAHRWVPIICLAAPIICYAADCYMLTAVGYKFGYELLIFNGLVTFLLLLASSAKFRTHNAGGNGHV
jgi:Na+/proline symporter